jgi:CheY-like chemotaxis protein
VGCVVLATDGAELRAPAALEAAAGASADRGVRAVLYAPAGLAKKEEAVLDRLGTITAVKIARSPERLIDTTALALHLRPAQLSEEQRGAVQKLHETDAALDGKKVLIVDDDIRNIFALTSVLEQHRMEVVAAETGREAIRRLELLPDVDIVLMDIMMPDMDGYDTMRAIRKIPRFKTLPIIAVTANAMKGDREKTLEAGAWDYLAKPVDTEHMLSVLRAWLHR